MTVKILQPILQRVLVRAGIDADYVFRRWVEMAEASPLDYFHITADGGLGELDLSELTAGQRRNLQSIKVTDYKDRSGYVTSTAVQVKMLNQQKAVEMIAKHLGLLVDRIDPDAVDRIGDLIEKGVSRIKARRDLEGWRDIELEEADFEEMDDSEPT